MKVDSVNTRASSQSLNETLNRASLISASNKSTLTPLKSIEEKSFFSRVSDKICGAFSWVKNKIVAFFSFIFFCVESAEKKAEKVKVLQENKALVENVRKGLIELRDAWRMPGFSETRTEKWQKIFDTLPQWLQDDLIAEDIRSLAREKSGTSEAVIEEKVIEGLTNPVTRAERLDFIRNLSRTPNITSIKLETVRALDDAYLPSYLAHIAGRLEKEIQKLGGAAS